MDGRLFTDDSKEQSQLEFLRAIDIGGKLIEENGKVIRMVLVAEPLFEVVVTSIDVYLRSVNKDGDEEWKPADVIPVGMADQDVDRWLGFCETPRHHLLAERPQSGSGIQNNLVLTTGDFDTGGISPGHSRIEGWQRFEERLRFPLIAELTPAGLYENVRQFLFKLFRGERRGDRPSRTPDVEVHTVSTVCGRDQADLA